MLPLAPLAVRVSINTASALVVTWKAPENNDLIASYTATARATAHGDEKSGTCSTNKWVCTIAGLEGHTEYAIAVFGCSQKDGEHAAACGLPSAPIHEKTSIESQFCISQFVFY